jgi:hypothetical protein
VGIYFLKAQEYFPEEDLTALRNKRLTGMRQRMK